MPRFIAVHPTSLTKKDLRRLVERHDEIPQDVLWNRTWSGTTEPVAYCDWEAATADAVAAVFDRFGVPFSSIHEVLYFRGDETGALDPGVGDAPVVPGKMRRFIAQHPDSLEEAALKSLVQRWRDELPANVQWCCTWAGVIDRVSFCDWRSPSAESVAYVLGKTGVPYEGLYEVVHFDRRLSIWHDPERPISTGTTAVPWQQPSRAALSQLSQRPTRGTSMARGTRETAGSTRG